MIGEDLPENGTFQLPDGSIMDKKMLLETYHRLHREDLLKNCQQFPNAVGFYEMIARDLSNGERFPIDGILMSKKDIYIKILNKSPRYYPVYYSLAALLEPGETVALMYREIMNKQQLVEEGNRVKLDKAYAEKLCAHCKP